MEKIEDLIEMDEYWGPRLRAIEKAVLSAKAKRDRRIGRNLKLKANGGFNNGSYQKP